MIIQLYSYLILSTAWSLWKQFFWKQRIECCCSENRGLNVAAQKTEDWMLLLRKQRIECCCLENRGLTVAAQKTEDWMLLLLISAASSAQGLDYYTRSHSTSPNNTQSDSSLASARTTLYFCWWSEWVLVVTSAEDNSMGTALSQGFQCTICFGNIVHSKWFANKLHIYCFFLSLKIKYFANQFQV